MWNYSSVEDSWSRRVEKLDKRIYNFLRQEIEDTRFYSKCLDGTSYVAVQNLDDIYDVLKYKDNETYKINSNYSPNFSGTDVSGNPISSSSFSDKGFYYRYNSEYGFTLKNLFTPTRLINDSTNYLEADVATTESINFNNINENDSLVIDGITLVDGHRVLVKDNTSNVTLNSSIDPDTYFSSNYYILSSQGSTITYFFYNSENGIYKYTNGTLVRESDLDTYLNNLRYSVSIKRGNTNAQKQFHLSRLLAGHYPLTSNSEPIEFTEKENFIVRNSLEYRNVLDNQFYKGLVQKTTTLEKNGLTYQIPDRFLSIGDFGFIVNYQNNYPNIIKNKYKENLRDIVELNDKYLIVGNNGTLLSLDKVTLIPDLNELDTFHNLSSIDFVDDNRGIIVGQNGTIAITNNQYNWRLINSNIKNDLNKVKFRNLSKAVIGGNNGNLAELTIKNNKVTFNQINLEIKTDLFDQKPVINDILDIDELALDLERFKFTNNNWVDISKNIGNSNFSVDFRFKPTDLTSGDKTVFSFITKKFPVTSGATLDKGISVKLVQEGSEYRVKLILNKESDPITFITLDGDTTIEQDKWYHVFITRDKGEYQFFINQQLADTTTEGFQGSFDNFNDRIRLGAELTYADSGTPSYSNTSFDHFEGSIDQVRLWNKKLDNNEVNIFSNNYKEDLSGLISWYKFNVYKPNNTKVIRTRDIIESTQLILPSSSNLTTYNTSGGTSMIDTETFTGILASGQNTLSIILDDVHGYTDQSVNTHFFVETSVDNIKNVVCNKNDKNFYGISEDVFKIDTTKFEFDLFNQINLLTATEELLLEEPYENLSIDLDTQLLYLIGGSNNQIETLDVSSICSTTENDPLENCGVYITVSTIGSTNSITIENNYRNDAYDEDNINSVNYIKTLGYPGSTQSILEIPIDLSGSPLDPYTELYLSLTLEDLFNGYFEVSMDNENYTRLQSNGDYLIPVTVGSDSTLRIRAVLGNDPIGNKVKGLIKDILFYEPSCVQIGEPKTYSGGTNIRKLYFTQFDTPEQLSKLNGGELYSYIDIKSIQIDGQEQLLGTTYSNNGLPKILYPDSFTANALVNCNIGDLCDYNPSLTLDTVDRVRYGFDLSVSGDNYTYNNDSYGLLESFTINTNQLFGVDRSNISNGSSNVSDPYFIGIDFTKSLYFEVDSMILSSDDLLNSDISNISGSQSVVIDATTFSYSDPSGTYFNQILFTASTSLTYSITTDKQINDNQTYYLEMELDGNVQFDFGTLSLTFSATGSIVNTTFRSISDESEFNISMTSLSSAQINNLVLSDRLPTKSAIEWDPDTCSLSYKLNGVDQSGSGYLLSDGSGEYVPTCRLNSECDNNDFVSSILDTTYWDNFKSKLLFLDYDIASKLYFFDLQTGVYQLPQTVNISDISKLEISSIPNQKSWLDYSKDSVKEFEYMSPKSDSFTVEYSSEFNITTSTASYDVILNGISTNDLSDINGATYGLLPNFDSATISIGTPSVATYSYYFYGKYLVMKQEPGFSASLGDIIRIENNFVTVNAMLIYKLDIGSDTYLYLSTNFNQSITNRLVNWAKTTTITNLNLFRNQSELIRNFNLHPISVGYKLIDNDDSTLTVDPQYGPKTAYYNLQARVSVTDSILNTTTQDMEYINKVLSFGYSPTYNILDYLSKNPNFSSSYRIGSLPQYDFENSNDGVLYSVSTGKISFNSSLKSEWDSILNNTFIDMTFGSTTLSSVLVINKSYDSDSDRYIIQTYNYYGHVYDQSDLSSSTWTLRVRNTLSEISSDLQKLNNIQRSSSLNYYITDLSNNQFTTYTSEKSELNFKPNTDSYAKALLGQKEIKEYVSAILYTDYKNELSVNMVNLSEERNLTITAIDKYPIDCEDCTYEDYISFTNPVNNNDFNQISLLSNTTYYTNRTPVSVYGFNNQIQIINATGSTFSDYNIGFSTQSGETRTLEFTVARLGNSIIKVFKDSTIINTVSILPDEKTKIQFSDNGVEDLIIRVEYTEGDNRVDINDIRVGNEGCFDNCYLTQLKIPNHKLSQGDGIILDLNETIFNLANEYESEFNSATQSGWVLESGGSTSSVGITNDVISITVSSTQSTLYYPQVFGLTAGETYRISFDYEYTFTSGTPSISPAFGTSTTLTTEFDELSVNGLFQNVQSNFIPTSSSVFIGFNLVGNGLLKVGNIKVDKLTDIGEYYDGYRVVDQIIDDNNVVINIEHNGNIEELFATFSSVNNCGQTSIKIRTISEIGTASQFIFDPYLNYAPIDLFELGVDDKIKQSIEIKPSNWIENSDETVSIVDLDMSNFRFRLIDNLSLVDLNNNYPWILESEIRNALIGKDSNGIVWYKGIWDCGRWFGGTWYSGSWRDGEWYGGTWNNSEIEDNIIKAEVDILNSKELKSVWYDGNFRGGTWNGGEWRNGNHYDGIWDTGNWLNSTWHMGTWNNGRFLRGTWIDGTWERGIFNCDLGESNWLDGTWNGGEFQCGRWFGGRFDSKNGLSRFGTKTDLSRKAIWENGSFINGEFNSGENIRHDLSIWKTGFWNNGTWNGGTAYQINWNNGVWNNGVVKDIPVVSFIGDSEGTYFFTLEGDWKFKLNDTFWIINNNIYSSVYGSDQLQARYKVDQDFITVNNGQYTKILVSRLPVALNNLIGNDEYVDGYIDNNNPSDDTIDPTQITTIVSNISKCQWYNGQFQNGIFDGTFFRNGIWEKGVMKSGDFGY